MFVLAVPIVAAMVYFAHREQLVKLGRYLVWGLPVLVFADLCLLLAAHMSIGATTEVDGTAPLGTLQPHTASSDNLPSAVYRLARAKAWLMVVVVALLSGLWPYLKLLGTL